MKIEGPKFCLWLDPNISAEELNEAAGAIWRVLLDPPRPQAEQRRDAVRKALAIYEGAPSRQAKQLAASYRSYLSLGWRLDRDLEELTERGVERVCLHALARANSGRGLCWRQIVRIAGPLRETC